MSNIHEDDEYGYDEMSEGGKRICEPVTGRLAWLAVSYAFLILLSEVEDADSRVPVLLQDSRAEKIAQNLYYMQS